MHRQTRGRVQRFLGRVDSYLGALNDAARRRAFLDRQINDWERRYARFLATDGVSEPVRDPADPPHAADFLLTIAALAKRRSSLSRGDRMHETNRHTDLNRAMLALLVAADQRCPSIIGHAHLLYHADGSSLRFDSAQAVAQIKSDAQDLLDAIAGAERALRTASFNTHPADSGRSS